jgi:plastocyanin
VRRSVTCLLALLVGTTLLAGCSKDEKAEEADQIAAATPLSVEVLETGGQTRILIPAIVKGGVVNLSYRNSGQAPHSLQFFKVAGSQPIADFVAFIATADEGTPTPDWISEGGGIGTVGPSQTGNASFELSAGRHFVYDEESDQDDVANVTKGGVAEVNVTEGEAGGPGLPASDATITAKEYEFSAGELKAGTTTVKFENTGQEPHHVVALPLAPGRTLDDVTAFLASTEPPAGSPPFDAEKAVSTAIMGPGKSVVTDLQLVAGDYALVCFIADRAGGPPHFTNGMLAQVTVA